MIRQHFLELFSGTYEKKGYLLGVCPAEFSVSFQPILKNEEEMEKHI